MKVKGFNLCFILEVILVVILVRSLSVKLLIM